jgi:hypothetical protein
MTRLRDGKPDVRIPAAARDFIFSKMSKHALRLVQTLISTEELSRAEAAGASSKPLISI